MAPSSELFRGVPAREAAENCGVFKHSGPAELAAASSDSSLQAATGGGRRAGIPVIHKIS